MRLSGRTFLDNARHNAMKNPGLQSVEYSFGCATLMEPQRWSERTARNWYARQPWLVGSNYIPATAVNQLEMWQADTFDPERIDTELGWARSLGMNTVRVFLHDLLWQQDAAG